MENKFNNRDFEQFVKQNADQYRMFPSEKVWEGINNTINTRRRWYGIGLALLLLTTATVTWVMLSPSNKKQQLVSANPTAKTATQPASKPEIIIAQAKQANTTNSFITSAERLQKTLLSANAITIAENDMIADADINEDDISPNYTEPVVPVPVSIQPELAVKPVAAIRTKQTPPAVKPAEKAVASNTTTNTVPFSFDMKSKENTETTPSVETFSFNKTDMYPLTIESVVNSYRFKRLKKKLSWQIFFTPTVSYRKLKENEGFLNAARPYTASSTSNNFTDVNSVVTHKPDLGVQLGFTAGYPLSKKLRITGGLQINVSKYDILAFTYPSEITTIALSTASGGSTVSTYTNYRNSGGSSNANWLRNLYTSASAPVGIELKLLGNKKSYLGVATTVQPTYILSNRAYLISTDYKNYAEIPSLVRKWNVNTGFEVFAGYSTGKLNWRVSPQVRYQTLSSFVDKYPVKEHLFDFGVKLGLMLK